MKKTINKQNKGENISTGIFERKYIVKKEIKCCSSLLVTRTLKTIVKYVWKSLSHLLLFTTPSTVHGILQAFPFCRGSSLPGTEPRSPALQADSLPAEPPGKPKNTGVGSLPLFQGIFPTQESNQGLLHCRWILYQLSYPRSPKYVYAHLIGKCQEIWQHQALEKMWINGICYTLPLGVLTGPATLENNLSPSWKIRYSQTLYIKHNNFSSLSISENPLVYWYSVTLWECS